MVRSIVSLILLLLAAPALAQPAAVRADGQTASADRARSGISAENCGSTVSLHDGRSLLSLRGDDLQQVVGCAGRDVLIEGSRGSFRLTGGCRSITLRGDLAIVQAELQPGSRVLIEGGGNLLAYALTRQGAVPSVTVRGEASRVRRVTRLGP